MTVEKKADFARRRNVNRATVTKWETKGLLVLNAAGLVEVEATEWNLDQRPPTYRGGTAHRPIRTVSKAEPDPREQSRRPERRAERDAPAPSRADTLNLRDVLVAMLDRIEAVVAFAVVAADGSPATAYAAVGIARSEMMEAASDLALSMGADDGLEGPLGRVEATAYPPDWSALADLFGHSLDVGAWREAAGSLPYWKDIEPTEAPHPWKESPTI